MTMKPNLIFLVQSLSNAKVLCVGDIMLDRFVTGSVDRISPEAPIPVLSVHNENIMLGGAGNVVRNLAALGAHIKMVSLIGDDDAGTEIQGLLNKLDRVDAHLVIDTNRQSSIKTRYLAGTQQMMRADQETIAPLDDKTRKDVVKTVTEALKEYAVLVLSDYGKGVLLDGMAKTLIDAAKKAGVAVIVDPKSTDYTHYAGASLITPNRQELRDTSQKPVDTLEEIVAAAEALVSEHNLGAILATRSRDGMTLLTSEGTVTHLAAEARDVFDVSGAGDTVVAAIAAATATGAALAEAAALANVAAGIVVGNVGTPTADAREVIAALHHQTRSDAEAKVLSQETLVKTVAAWREQNLRIGFTNGCFDLLHPGHVSLLHQAKDGCDRLIVGLNADASVKRLKGNDRPVQIEAARATVLASLASVNAVAIFSEDTPLALIKTIRPDVLVKGKDYKLEEVVGAKEVKSYGGHVLLAKLSPGHSTTATIEKLNKNSA